MSDGVWGKMNEENHNADTSVLFQGYTTYNRQLHTIPKKQQPDSSVNEIDHRMNEHVARITRTDLRPQRHTKA